MFVGFDAATSVFAFFMGTHADHYSGTASRLLTAGQVHHVDVPLLRKQFGSVDVTVADAQTGAPIGGVPLGELWYLHELAMWLREHDRSRFLLTAPPLRLPGIALCFSRDGGRLAKL